MCDTPTAQSGSGDVPGTDIVERLRQHVNNRGGAVLQNGAWQMMLDGAAEIESLRDRLDFAEFEWRRATDGMKERDTEIERVQGYVSRWRQDPAVRAALHRRPEAGLDELLTGMTEENLHGEIRTGATVADAGHIREVLEHVTELLVDTWHTAMDGDPEKEAAVVDSRAALATEGK